MLVFKHPVKPKDGVNRESERIIKKTAFLTVEDSLQVAAGIFNSPRRAGGEFMVKGSRLESEVAPR
jgi:hypothetical protein